MKRQSVFSKSPHAVIEKLPVPVMMNDERHPNRNSRNDGIKKGLTADAEPKPYFENYSTLLKNYVDNYKSNIPTFRSKSTKSFVPMEEVSPDDESIRQNQQLQGLMLKIWKLAQSLRMITKNNILSGFYSTEIVFMVLTKEEYLNFLEHIVYGLCILKHNFFDLNPFIKITGNRFSFETFSKDLTLMLNNIFSGSQSSELYDFCGKLFATITHKLLFSFILKNKKDLLHTLQKESKEQYNLLVNSGIHFFQDTKAETHDSRPKIESRKAQKLNASITDKTKVELKSIEFCEPKVQITNVSRAYSTEPVKSNLNEPILRYENIVKKALTKAKNLEVCEDDLGASASFVRPSSRSFLPNGISIRYRFSNRSKITKKESAANLHVDTLVPKSPLNLFQSYQADTIQLTPCKTSEEAKQNIPLPPSSLQKIINFRKNKCLLVGKSRNKNNRIFDLYGISDERKIFMPSTLNLTKTRTGLQRSHTSLATNSKMAKYEELQDIIEINKQKLDMAAKLNKSFL